MTAHDLRLGVNIDHVATVRNARGGAYPDPLRAAKLAEEAGADGITAHLREDRRHISDADIDGLMVEPEFVAEARALVESYPFVRMATLKDAPFKQSNMGCMNMKKRKRKRN